ncbi:MAG: FHA domain-containing protein [Hormoscilla sp. GM7CHS1pb]|nr:FHA domain-containing protein [Hormoscilla sp. GM7CHS1pb]
MSSFRIQLSWRDPVTGADQQQESQIPVAIGRELGRMPPNLRGEQVFRLVLGHNEVSRYHTLIDVEQGQAVVRNQSTTNGTLVNGTPLTWCFLMDGDTLQIGPYQIAVRLVQPTGSNFPPPAFLLSF